MTSETLDFESEHVFESHKHLQSTADMMLALTCFYIDQIGPNLGQIWAKSGQIRPKQQILKVETRDFDSINSLRILTTTSAYIRLFELTTVTKWVNLTKIGPNVGPKGW